MGKRQVSMLTRRREFREEDHPVIDLLASYFHLLTLKGFLRRESAWSNHTLMMGSWPLIASSNFFFLTSTFKSLAFRLPGISTETSRSPIVCVHLYGRAACSSFSFAAAVASCSLVGSRELVRHGRLNIE